MSRRQPQIPAVTVYQLTRFEFLTGLGGEEAHSSAPVHNIFSCLGWLKKNPFYLASSTARLAQLSKQR